MHLWWESEWCSHHGKQYGGSSEKLNTELPYNPAISFLSIHPKDVKTGSQRGICTPLFTAALCTIINTWTQPKCPSTDEQIKKMWCIYICCSTIKKDGKSAIGSNMKKMTQGIMLSERSQSKQTLCDITYDVESKKYNKLMNITKKKQTHI